MKEVWLDIAQFEGVYKVSSLGRIMSMSRKLTDGRHIKSKILNPKSSGNHGYLVVNLKNGNICRLAVPVHRLVAETFISNPDNLPEVNHKDGNKLNNCVDNLEWCSYKDNLVHALKNNLMAPHLYAMYGEKHPGHKITDAQVEEIRYLHSQGVKSSELARQYNLSKTHVSKIVNNLVRVNKSEVKLCELS